MFDLFLSLNATDQKTIFFSVIVFASIGLILAGMILYTRAKLIGSAVCRILINNDHTLTRETQSGNTLLNALTSSGVPIPSPCGGKATCKQCKVKVLSGCGEPLETETSSFSKKQLAEGWRLSCQCKLKNDVEIHVEPHFLDVKKWTCKVISNQNVATFIKELIVELPEGEVINYKSGGYLQIHVPPYKTNTGEWRSTMDALFFADWDKNKMFDRQIDFSHLPEETIRAYSMASYPAEGRKLIFNIRIATPPFVQGALDYTIPWGICSSYTFGLKPGDDITVSGPYGESFMLHDSRQIVFLIGGAGSSFGRSHVLDLFKTHNTQRKVSFWYGARSLKENIYYDEYLALAKEHPNFTYHLVLSEPLPEDLEKGWDKSDPIKTNFLFRAFEMGQLKQMPDPENALFYVCGPPMHNKSVMKLLDDYGVPRNSIILDDFGG